MDVVREIISDSSESSDIELHVLDSNDELSSSGSCQTDHREDSITSVTSSENAGRNDMSTTQKKAQSLLDVLKCPQPSILARKRKIITNNPPTGKRSCKSTNRVRKQSKAAASIKPQQRVNEFKGEHLCVSSGKLFCNACREEVNLKKSSVKNHIRSIKHKNSSDALKTKNKREKSITEAIQQHNSEVQGNVAD